MAKVSIQYICSNCGAKSPQMLGRCPQCGAWGTFEEERSITTPAVLNTKRTTGGSKAIKLADVSVQQDIRMDMHCGELNRVLGGGLVPGSLVLLGGEPGIGKSTLALQVLMQLGDMVTLYASGEESVRQIKLRAERLKGKPTNLHLLADTSIDNILLQAEQLHPQVVIIDSIQTMGTETLEASIGSLSQIRECTNKILLFAKENNISFFIVGHITKEGTLAGPKVLEHIVDTVLQFEGDQHYMYRILRSQKNRFGSTSEIGIFEMLNDGLREVTNPSELLLTENREGLSGIAIAGAIEGIRPLIIEVQALVASAAYGTPQRSSTGFDARRLNMLLAVLEKRVGFKLLQKDVFINIAGGLRVNDPAIDLAVLVAILSSNMDISVDPHLCLAGEVGLAGEIRPINRIEQRIHEAEKLGFTRMIIPSGQKLSISNPTMELIRLTKVADALRIVFKQ